MISHADPSLGPVLRVVVCDDGGEGAAEDLKAGGVDDVVEPLLELAVRELTHEGHARGQPSELEDTEHPYINPG